MGCSKVYLYDGTSVTCKDNNLTYDLTYYKLLEKSNTFYTGLGFDFDISITNSYTDNFLTKKKLKKFINKVLICCRKIKISTLISEYKKLLKICTKNIDMQSSTSKIIVRCGYMFNLRLPLEVNNIWICKTSIYNLLNECIEMLQFLNSSNDKYLYEFLVKLFKSENSCFLLESFEKYILNSNTYEIEYNNIILSRQYLQCFRLLKKFRYSNYSYEFV